MISERVEVNIVMVAWVVAILLGLSLLLIKAPNVKSHTYYNIGKNICAVALLLFGCDILFQWLLRVLEIANPILSVSVYLFTFCGATLLLAIGYCFMVRPKLANKKQLLLAASVLLAFTTILIINYFLPYLKWQKWGILGCCVLLFLITCGAIYNSVAVYRAAITNLRTYYSDVVENMLRWMPGVGLGVLLFLLSAPCVMWLPRWCGIYQISLGIILFIYSFVCVINFSAGYSTMAATHGMGDDPADALDAADPVAEAGAADSEPQTPQRATRLSDSLREIMQEKEQRWCDQGGYRTPGITIDQAARAMGTNRSYLSRYLNEVKHMTFYEWVAWMRITEAQTLMRESPSMSIEQLAARVGFSTASTFSSTFKKLVGYSPKQWRNRQFR